MKDVILRYVEQEPAARPRQPRRAKFPIIESKRPGTLHITNEEIYEIVFSRGES